jgi:hypothetical protein
VDADVVEVTDAIAGPDVTDTVGRWEAGVTGEVGEAGLALAAWWQEARWRFFPSRQDHGDEVGEEDWEVGEYVDCEGVGDVEEGGDWDMKRGGESGGHLVDPVCS